MKRTLKIYWTGAKGEPVGKRVTYNPDEFTEAEVVAHVVRTYDPYHSPEDIGVHQS
jgi:hypothetical protein